eukprot:TRINITY_DN11752_c0_g1_i1.p1 TRINITY_DN11752_c0_g1~~TRINITY_DN11752_c0_g1_i1.p1  ORF type:complete len:598 (-),score=159.13 TRINITY_DN11752_c0_g1_i1:313-1998(-)
MSAPTNTRVQVHSENVVYDEQSITSAFTYSHSEVDRAADGTVHVTPKESRFVFNTSTQLPRLGVMMVGLGGNNGTTVTAGIIANREGITWRTKTGVQRPNFFGSITQASTMRLGYDRERVEVNVPMKDVVPFVDPRNVVVGGWDISGMCLSDAMERAGVLDYDLQRQLVPYMRPMVPLPSIYNPDFIAANQSDRADNVLPADMPNKEKVEKLREDIRQFRAANNLDTVVVLWTANTERFCEITAGIHDSDANVLAAIDAGHKEISPSTLFAVASIQEGCTFINGSPQNTLVPGVLQLAAKRGVFVAGDDFKSGQTKFKSVLTDFLINAGIKVTAIVSYNHLGNNDGKNLSAPSQFRSKEISKSNVVDDLVASNPILYAPGEHPDHVVVIKYVPTVGDSKRALDEYTSEIFMGGTNTIVCHNTCEDSLLAAPLIIDLFLLAELFSRVQLRKVQPTGELGDVTHMHSVLSPLAYLLKAPMVPENTPIINALFRQRACIENILRALVGLPPEDNLLLQFKLPRCEKVDTLDASSPMTPVLPQGTAAAAATASASGAAAAEEVPK